MKRKLPTLSVIVVSYNNAKILPACLAAIQAQDYPKELIEYINVDGGSTDETCSLMARHGFRIIESSIPRNAEAQRAIGLHAARHEILAYIDTDNILPSSDWLRQMVWPFQAQDDILCSQTLHYTYRKDDTIFNRYCALFGVSDPVVYYVGRPDRLPWFTNRWVLGDRVQDMGAYYRVQFSEKNLPTVGCNGILVRRDPLVRYAATKPEQFLHIDVFIDLFHHGFNTFAIVKNDIVHATAYTLQNLVNKRIAFLKYYFGQKVPRRYKIYDPMKVRDTIRLIFFVFYTVTIIKPLIDSMKGYLRVRDIAWFMHPLVCWVYLYAYGTATIKYTFRTLAQSILWFTFARKEF